MSEPSYGGLVEGLVVTETIEGAHPKHETYPLLPGDLLIEEDDGTFYKFGPGLGVTGFVLTEDQRATLRPSGERRFGVGGFDFAFGGDR